MDYAGEELKRQRLALAALLTGGAMPEQREIRQEAAWESLAEGFAGGAMDFRDPASVWGSTWRRSAADGENGTVRRTGPFGWEDEASGNQSGLLETEVFAGRRDVGTGIPSAGGGDLDSAEREDLTARAAALARMAAAERANMAGPERDADAAGVLKQAAGAESTEARKNRQVPEDVRAEVQGRRTAWELPGATSDGWLSYAAGTAASQEGVARTASVFARQAEAAEVRALSLAFQRDARRYDGGFAIY